MKTILAFGDSNTWGYVPGSKPRERYPFGVRWTSLVKIKTGVRVVEEGLCGRTTAFEDALRPGRNGRSSLPAILDSKSPLDGAIIMLGTNDCKPVYAASAHIIGKGIERCLDEVEKDLPPENILLISPIFLGEDVWKEEKDPEFGKTSAALSRELPQIYHEIAKRRGNAFLAASDFASADNADCEHMNAEGHISFADAVCDKLGGMGLI